MGSINTTYPILHSDPLLAADEGVTVQGVLYFEQYFNINSGPGSVFFIANPDRNRNKFDGISPDPDADMDPESESETRSRSGTF
jgi:hypothetical protein